jgi:hypothetical protein
VTVYNESKVSKINIYKGGILKNFNPFVERLENDPNILTNEDVEEREEEDINNVNSETGLNVYLNRELDLVKDW